MSGTFCSMGGMTMSSNGKDNGSVRNQVYKHAASEMNPSYRMLGYDHDIQLPVIMTDDTDGNNGHGMHQMDHGNMDHGNMDHGNMDNNMDHDMGGMDHSMGHMSMGTIMYMDGFHSALFSSSDTPPPCLNLFYPSLTLDSEAKFVFAMIFIALLGVMVEACGVWRVKCLRRGRYIRRRERLKRQRQQLSGDSSQVEQSLNSVAPFTCPAMIRRVWRTLVPQCLRNAANKCCNINTRDASKQIKRYEIMAASLHATRAWFGYLLMLAVMSYAIEFMVCTIVGMVLGRYWFIEVDEDVAIDVINSSGQMEGNNNFSGGDGMWGGGDPCCGIDDDDEDFSTADNMDAASEVETRLMQNDPSGTPSINEPLLSHSILNRRSPSII